VKNWSPDAVNRPPQRDSRRQSLHGVNQTIANALSMLLARPLLMLLPLVLDICLWLGWQFSPEPFTTWLGKVMIDNGGSDGPAAAREIFEIGERARVNDLLATLTPSIFGGVPKDSFLTILLALFAPNLIGGIDRRHMVNDWDEGLFAMLIPENGLGVFALALFFLAGSTVLAVAFRVPQARAIREEPVSLRGVVIDMLECWWKLLVLIALLLVVGAAIILPLFIIVGILYLLGINLMALVVLGLLVFGGMVAMYTYFTIDAVVLNRAGPLQAISLSYAVVRENFGPCSRFIFTSMLIFTGVLQVWDVLVENPPGVFIALVGNAFLGTGLSIASMLFFNDRLRLLDPNTVLRAASVSRRWFR